MIHSILPVQTMSTDAAGNNFKHDLWRNCSLALCCIEHH